MRTGAPQQWRVFVPRELLGFRMYRLGQWRDGEWVEYSHQPIFERRTTRTNVARLDVGVPGSDLDVLRALMRCTEPMYYILYVLLVPRGEGKVGRYQSPSVNRQELDSFLSRYENYFRADGRFSLWVHSPSSEATLVWDRHNIVHAYGPLSCFEKELGSIGFRSGSLTIPAPHEHHYRQEFDADAAAVMAHFQWRQSELEPGDDD